MNQDEKWYMIFDEKEPVDRNEGSKIDAILIISDLSLVAFFVSWYAFAPKGIVVALLLFYILSSHYNQNQSVSENAERYKASAKWLVYTGILAIAFIFFFLLSHTRETGWIIFTLLVERCVLLTPSSQSRRKLMSMKNDLFQIKNLIRVSALVLIGAGTVYNFYPVYRENLITKIEEDSFYYLGLDYNLQIGAFMMLSFIGVALLGYCLERIITKKKAAHGEKLTVYDFWVSVPMMVFLFSLEVPLYYSIK